MLEGLREFLVVAKDLIVFFLFLESLVVIALLIVLVWQVMRLVQIVSSEVTPILDSVRRTSSTVKGTAEFVSETTVKPVITFVSAASAASRFVRSFFGLTSRR